MSMFDKWWDAANAPDREKMTDLLDDRFVILRHQTSEEFNKEHFNHFIMTGIRERVPVEDSCLILLKRRHWFEPFDT